ncbi:hypothetical protein KVR01_003414 [Diaporthe batatas]|uniref:uncharacterized protein n=1 Tax=Diaporthe batatas TaxID=748121 RepID=UPI001D05A443|nr:uncharacterized protein KVR01_003414 [Diaporthe batatas]KAG8167725.1 hypothetical protein KVR01_003414 [Diaporthe batatas]
MISFLEAGLVSCQVSSGSRKSPSCRSSLEAAVNGSSTWGLTQTVEHYRIIQTLWFQPQHQPHYPTPSRSKGTYLVDDCMEGPPSLALPGIVAAEEAHGQQRYLGSSPECMLGHRGAACLVQGRDAMHASTGTPMAVPGKRGPPGCLGRAILLPARLLQSLRPDPTPVQQRGPTTVRPPTCQQALQAPRALVAPGSVARWLFRSRVRPHCPSPPHPCSMRSTCPPSTKTPTGHIHSSSTSVSGRSWTAGLSLGI